MKNDVFDLFVNKLFDSLTPSHFVYYIVNLILHLPHVYISSTQKSPNSAKHMPNYGHMPRIINKY